MTRRVVTLSRVSRNSPHPATRPAVIGCVDVRSGTLPAQSEPRLLLEIEEGAKLFRPRRMPQLAQRLGLDLADALAGHVELLADFFQRVVGVHVDAEAHPQHLGLA